MSDSVSGKRAGAGAIALVSPGLLPVPPVLGGSVETVMHEMAQFTQEKFKIDIYGPTGRSLPPKDNIGNINYYRFPAKPYSDYFKKVREQLVPRNYPIIQVENRPLFIPKTKKISPDSQFILSLHSLDHIDRKLIRPAITQAVFTQCDRILVYSKFMRNSLANKFPKLSNKISFIHLGVKTELFRPSWTPELAKEALALRRKLGIPANHKVLLFAGRVIPKKGVHHIITAMEQILKHCPKCTLVVVGGSWYANRQQTDYIKSLHQQAGKFATKIRFTNYVGSSEMPLLFAMSDIFLCPSLWDEPFGLVNVEAMAVGLPVVASARGGIPEIVTDGLNGFLVRNENDHRSFVKPIVRLLRDPDLATAFGRNGRKMVEDYFNWPRAGRQLTELYKEMLDNSENYSWAR